MKTAAFSAAELRFGAEYPGPRICRTLTRMGAAVSSQGLPEIAGPPWGPPESRPRRWEFRTAKYESRPRCPEFATAKCESRPCRPDFFTAKCESRPRHLDFFTAKRESRLRRPDFSAAKRESRLPRPEFATAKRESRLRRSPLPGRGTFRPRGRPERRASL